jgi:AcrR family transcriptional regulator
VNRTDRRKLEVRERILAAAYDLFLRQGITATIIEDICEAADVANRTFFNHFPTRQDMIRALADQRLGNLHDVVFDGARQATPTRLVTLFDEIGSTLAKSGDTHRELVGAMVNAAGYGVPRGSSMHDTFVGLIKEGIAQGEITMRQDPQRLADIIVGALTGAIVNWTVDRTYALQPNMHELGTTLATLLTAPDDSKPTGRRSRSVTSRPQVRERPR